MIPTVIVPHGIKARRDPYGRGWLAEFHGPDGIGFRMVEASRGIGRLFGSRIEAERAAMAALCEALTAVKIERSRRARIVQVQVRRVGGLRLMERVR